ncbi:elongation factor P maturation arginine rhamnosyltransferase EarP [Azoarcus indigens]|uniref:Protein-arginine rhamnosyltransferase n=1 Tax=Azoarcus indigens TaxID=29545 RepID=A0A4R6DTB9_9RHOO|nr:elongation factor P maturation arginine rhamnosyltransferase EarP [Azoarcus indigens]NMG65270.1 elongation factor P maturation arginine rhamnosyltransferase EarP [Azoarcus indigens]TDN47914.1 putative repeat protein (TIGR03837 family) [Azoarcus indigens]
MADFHALPRSWEIFCQVVDNFGDIGVCLRLARALATDPAREVRLWVDDWQALSRLCPGAAGLPAEGGKVEGVELRRWRSPFPAVEPAEVVIEAFACELPPSHLQAMAARPQPPQWINLEYLSAEDWVAGCHGLGSPHPRLGLAKRFFFPGFTADTGGLLRESGLLAARDVFQAAERAAWLAATGPAGQPDDTLWISLFAYEQPGLAALAEHWAQGDRPVCLLVPEGRVLADVAAAFGRPRLEVGETARRGALSARVLPFTDQAGYDRLLWACDLNLVRGEDSFVRAQWAARPLAWHIYAQEEEAHFHKLQAFLDLYGADLQTPALQALTDFWLAWNGRGDTAAAWPIFAAALPELARHARQWSARQARLPDLVERLLELCTHSVKANG